MSETSEDCIFCRIVDGEIPSHAVHETATVLAFLDANPLATGHTLVIPKTHHERLTDCPPSLARDVMEGVHRVTGAVEAAVDADGATVAFNDGEAAGQEVPHVHGHVVPRSTGDGGRPIHALFDARPDLSEEELAGVAEDVADRL